MTPKEEALNLHNKFYVIGFTGLQRFTNGNMIASDAIQAALIAVDEIVEALELYGKENYELQNMDRTLAYYDEVKLEIQSL